MMDSYFWGKVDRISPEAPVPVVHVTESESRMGGAANVALNVHTLGARPVVCTVIGKDNAGDRYMDLMDARGFETGAILRLSSRQTTVKTRIISQGQHLLRVDEERPDALNPEESDLFLQHILATMERERPDVIVLEDYNKGILTESVIRGTIAAANAAGIPTAVDPKKDHFFAYAGCTLFKPNLKELREGLKVEADPRKASEFLEAAVALESRMANQLSLITLSEFGVFVKQGEEAFRIPAHRREIVDVSGAGDTVIAVAALCLAQGMPHRELAALSNLAGGLVCEKVGVVPIEQLQLLDEAADL